jgi:hypothetical protein
VRETEDTLACAQRLVERSTEGESAVLCRVVIINVKVTVALNFQVESYKGVSG